MSETQLLAYFIAQIEKLQNDRKIIDDKIAALNLAYETMSGGQPVRTKRAVANKTVRRLRRDTDGSAKVLSFLRDRRQPAGIPQITRELRCSAAAASARLRALMAAGNVKRIGRGLYQVAS